MKSPADVTALLESSETSIVSRLFRAHGRKLLGLLKMRLHDSEEARDAAQDVFLKLWRHEIRGGLRDDSRAYMYAATQTIATDAVRARFARGYGQHADVEADALPDGEISLEDRLHWREAMARFTEAIRGLPEPIGAVFLLSYLEGLTHPQIAETLGLSERTVDRHLVRALTMLRAQMKEFL
jgi:RNA polymerase sigma-70 factor (ECF subfamily)